jgi:hypothetical protein
MHNKILFSAHIVVIVQRTEVGHINCSVCVHKVNKLKTQFRNISLLSLSVLKAPSVPKSAVQNIGVHLVYVDSEHHG